MPDEPDTTDFFDADLAGRLAALAIQSRQPMLGTVSGRHQSPHRGSSVEFAEYRRYQPGDDLRRLDWRAFARSDRFYVKEFEADTNLRLVFVVDCSGSMGYGQKLDQARRIVATLAYLAIEQGDAAGLIGASAESPVVIPPRRNATQVSVLFESLGKLSTDGDTTVLDALHELAGTIRQRAMVVVISDLFVEIPELRSAIEHLRFCKHDVAVFHLMDPEELSPSWNRRVRIDDMEGGGRMMIDPDEIVPAYQAEVRAHLEAIETLARETATDYHFLVDQSIEEVLTKFLSDRAMTGKAR